MDPGRELKIRNIDKDSIIGVSSVITRVTFKTFVWFTRGQKSLNEFQKKGLC